jgi:hypothetical protein
MVTEAELSRILMARQRERGDDQQMNVLILSGGAQNGAFGAGVLKGWLEAGAAPRPGDFDIVTGISTGALQATHAFLGDQDSLAKLGEIYTNVSDSDIIDKRSYAVALTSNALATLGPLRKLLKRHLNDELIRQAAAKAGGRNAVFVGTTSLDSGQFVIWNLSQMAREEKYDLYRKVVLASAAMPVFMEPIWIKGEMHFDGGVREQLFYRSFLPLLEEVRARGEKTRAAPTQAFFLLVNGRVCTPAVVIPNCIKDIALRTIDVLVDEAMLGNINKIRVAAGEGVLGLKYIPDSFTDEPQSEFDRDYMRRLFGVGVAEGKTNWGWRDPISDCTGMSPRARVIVE